jgi:hypothetical protein
MPTITLRGASGKQYQYVVPDPGKLIMTPGNFVFIRDSTGGPALIYAGESDNMSTAIKGLWGTAKSLHGASDFAIHPNPDPDTRRREQADLVSEHGPPMNRST